MTEIIEETGVTPEDEVFEPGMLKTVGISHESVQIVEADTVIMEQSAAFSVLAEEAEINNSAAFIVRADEARVQDSVTFILAAGEVKGNVTTLFTPITAAILGVSIMIGIWLIRPRH
jgi:hypothetical protein